MKGFSTRAIHCTPAKQDPHGSLRTPVYDSAAFEFGSSRELQRAFEGKRPAHAYSRITNPTVEDFERRVRELSGALGVIATSSGMAAIGTLALALGAPGGNVVTTRFLFANTVSLFEHTLGRWGLETRYVDFSRPETVGKALDTNTRFVFVEAITNPQLEVADIVTISSIAADAGVPVILDGTLTTPYLFRSKDHGVALEVLSSTKYLSGGATSVGGLIIDNGTFDWSANHDLGQVAAGFGPYALLKRLRGEVYRNLGVCLSPHNAYLQTLGLETLAMRIEKSCANALEISRCLDSHPNVKGVNYPGLESSPSQAVAARQFGNRFGALLTLDLGSRERCFRFMDSLKLIRRATNLNDNKTLVIHPASTIFADYPQDERDRMGVPDSMIRVAAGIEEAEDIIEDIRQGLAAL